MKRYGSTKIDIRWDGKRVYKITEYPHISPADDDIIIITNEADFLDSLAQKYYNDSSLWWIIAAANNIGEPRLGIETGIQLRIPIHIDLILSAFDKINSKKT
jgi:hypothetical protein